MGKFHINKQGKVAECKATIKPCPLGGEGEHIKANSLEEAQKEFDKKHSKENSILAGSLPLKDKKVIVKNAIKATKTSGYNQIITVDENGEYSIHQTKDTIWESQSIVGETNIQWNNGIMNVEYKDVPKLTAIETYDTHMGPIYQGNLENWKERGMKESIVRNTLNYKDFVAEMSDSYSVTRAEKKQNQELREKLGID